MTIEQKLWILNKINEQTFQTGSLAYGIPNPTDHDRFCTRAVFDEISAILHELNTEICQSESGGTPAHSITFDLAGEKFNIFVVRDDEIEIAKAVTEMVTIAAKCQPRAAAIKPLRILLFRTLRDTLAAWQKLHPAQAVVTFANKQE